MSELNHSARDTFFRGKVTGNLMCRNDILRSGRRGQADAQPLQDRVRVTSGTLGKVAERGGGVSAACGPPIRPRQERLGELGERGERGATLCHCAAK